LPVGKENHDWHSGFGESFNLLKEEAGSDYEPLCVPVLFHDDPSCLKSFREICAKRWLLSQHDIQELIRGTRKVVYQYICRLSTEEDDTVPIMSHTDLLARRNGSVASRPEAVQSRINSAKPIISVLSDSVRGGRVS
jgi:hypothetical protein